MKKWFLAGWKTLCEPQYSIGYALSMLGMYEFCTLVRGNQSFGWSYLWSTHGLLALVGSLVLWLPLILAFVRGKSKHWAVVPSNHRLSNELAYERGYRNGVAEASKLPAGLRIYPGSKS